MHKPPISAEYTDALTINPRPAQHFNRHQVIIGDRTFFMTWRAGHADLNDINGNLIATLSITRASALTTQRCLSAAIAIWHAQRQRVHDADT